MPRFRSTPRLIAALATCCLAAAPARAELVVLTSGEIDKVKAFDADERDARLELPCGGVMTLPLERVERVIEDEVEEPVAAPDPVAAAALDLKFVDGAGIPDGTYGGLAYWAAKKHAL